VNITVIWHFLTTACADKTFLYLKGENAITVKLSSTMEQNLVLWVTRHPRFVHPLLWKNVEKSEPQNNTYSRIPLIWDVQLLQWQESDTKAGVKLVTGNSNRISQGTEVYTDDILSNDTLTTNTEVDCVKKIQFITWSKHTQVSITKANSVKAYTQSLFVLRSIQTT
jgi:hypothetical protein